MSSPHHLTCALCLEKYNKKELLPKSLPCLHTFCRQCLILFLQQDHASDQLPCPTCRKLFPRPENGVDDLPTNFMVRELMETSQPANLMCSRHMDKAACVVCLDCQVGLCTLCITKLASSPHVHHNLADVESLVQAASQLCEDMEHIKADIDSIQQEKLKHLTKCATSANQRINKIAKKTTDKVRDWKKKTLGKIEKVTAEANRNITLAYDNLHGKVLSSDTVMAGGLQQMNELKQQKQELLELADEFGKLSFDIDMRAELKLMKEGDVQLLWPEQKLTEADDESAVVHGTHLMSDHHQRDGRDELPHDAIVSNISSSLSNDVQYDMQTHDGNAVASAGAITTSNSNTSYDETAGSNGHANTHENCGANSGAIGGVNADTNPAMNTHENVGADTGEYASSDDYDVDSNETVAIYSVSNTYKPSFTSALLAGLNLGQMPLQKSEMKTRSRGILTLPDDVKPVYLCASLSGEIYVRIDVNVLVYTFRNNEYKLQRFFKLKPEMRGSCMFLSPNGKLLVLSETPETGKTVTHVYVNGTDTEITCKGHFGNLNCVGDDRLIYCKSGFDAMSYRVYTYSHELLFEIVDREGMDFIGSLLLYFYYPINNVVINPLTHDTALIPVIESDFNATLRICDKYGAWKHKRNINAPASIQCCNKDYIFVTVYLQFEPQIHVFNWSGDEIKQFSENRVINQTPMPKCWSIVRIACTEESKELHILFESSTKEQTLKPFKLNM